LAWLPADNLRIARRGGLAQGYLADVVVFDAATIQDRATLDRSHQYATGVVHLLVNGEQVVRSGARTGLARALRRINKADSQSRCPPRLSERSWPWRYLALPLTN
jgi:N-acyl-D-aspartate/D-glutamate deacylase